VCSSDLAPLTVVFYENTPVTYLLNQAYAIE
jgi:hypothetical protein